MTIDSGKAMSYQFLSFQPICELDLDKNLTYMIRKYAAELLNTVILRVRAFFKVILNLFLLNNFFRYLLVKIY